MRILRRPDDHDQSRLGERAGDGRSEGGRELPPLPVLAHEAAEGPGRALAPVRFAGERGEAKEQLGRDRTVLDRLLAHREAPRRVACRRVPEPAGRRILEGAAHRPGHLRGGRQRVRVPAGLVLVEDGRDRRRVIGEEAAQLGAVTAIEMRKRGAVPHPLAERPHHRHRSVVRVILAEGVGRGEVRGCRERVPTGVDPPIDERRAMLGSPACVERVVALVGVL